MNSAPFYELKDGLCYVLIEDQMVGRELGHLQFAIELAQEKIVSVDSQMDAIDDDLPGYGHLQDVKNDLEMMISCFEDRIGILRNRPRTA